MPSYAAPLDDLRFLINDLFDMPNDPDVPGAADVTPDLIDAVLEGGAKICAQVFQPLNQSGDAEAAPGTTASSARRRVSRRRSTNMSAAAGIRSAWTRPGAGRGCRSSCRWR